MKKKYNYVVLVSSGYDEGEREEMVFITESKNVAKVWCNRVNHIVDANGERVHEWIQSLGNGGVKAIHMIDWMLEFNGAYYREVEVR